MLSEHSPINVDLRILEENYKGHFLLARYLNGEYIGQIWKNRQKIADYEGTDLDLIIHNLRALVDILLD